MARALILGATGLLIDTFYRRVRLGGAVPADGPLIVVANHVNQLVDVAIALRTIGRPAASLAKAPLFRRPPMSWLMRGVGALPVHRACDGERDEAAKAETRGSLDAVARVVGDGGCLLLFPEGLSHDEPGVLPVHSGAARVAYGAAARIAAAAGAPSSLRIVPLGLLYRDKHRLGSEAVSLVGEPIAWTDLLPQWRDDEPAAVVALTQRIEAALRGVTLHLESWDDLPLLEAATVLHSAGADQPRTLAALGEGIRRLRARAPAELDRLRDRVADHALDLARLGARPDERRRVVASAVVRHAVSCLAAPIVAVAGLVARRPALVAQARTSLRDGWRFLRALLRGRFIERVRREQRALRAEVDVLMQAARNLPAVAPVTPTPA